MNLPAEPVKDGENPPSTGVAEKALAGKVEREDLERRIRVLRRRGKDHLLWTLLGISPAAIIPAFGLLLEGSTGLLALLGLLVTVTQGHAWVRVSREVEGLQERLDHLRAGD